MSSSVAELKAQMRRIGEVKERDAAAALAEHLKLSIGERIEAGIRLSQALLRASTDRRPGDDEAAAMARVADHLKRLRHG